MLILPVITGPTASGKSELVYKLAQSLDTEIISSDSIQIYRKFNIGAAKPSGDQLTHVKHHFIDIIDYSETYSVALYQKAASGVIERMISCGKTPVVSGGTGLYIRSLIGTDDYTNVMPNDAFRAQCNYLAETKGLDYLHNRLTEIDYTTSLKLHPNDKRRIIRALEIYEFSGRPMSDRKVIHNVNRHFSYKVFGLHWEREELYSRIETRVEQMLGEGLVQEVQELKCMGATAESAPMRSLGYKQVDQYLEGIIPYKTMTEMIKKETRNYAKRQLTWNRNQFDVIWLNPYDGINDNVRKIIALLK